MQDKGIDLNIVVPQYRLLDDKYPFRVLNLFHCIMALRYPSDPVDDCSHWARKLNQ